MIRDRTHTDDCQGGDECEPIDGQWNQPAGTYRREAEAELGDDAPTCRIFELAWELDAAEELRLEEAAYDDEEEEEELPPELAARAAAVLGQLAAKRRDMTAKRRDTL